MCLLLHAEVPECPGFTAHVTAYVRDMNKTKQKETGEAT